MSKVVLTGLDKADVLAALFNASKPQGLGFLSYDPKPMTREEAKDIIERRERRGDDITAIFGFVYNDDRLYFDYLKGRAIKVDLSGDELDPCGYDRDNGQGAAERAIAELRKTGSINSSIIQTMHHLGTLESAEDVKSRLNEKSRMTKHRGTIKVLRLGLSDVAELGPAVDEAIKKLQA